MPHLPSEPGDIDLTQLSDEELAELGKQVGMSIQPSDAPRPPLPAGAGLVPASSLLTPEQQAELDQGDFEPSPEGTRYKGFLLVPKHLWPNEPQHAHLTQRFYVETLIGTIGLVPWEGSQIVWPWHAAWSQDLHRTEVTPLLKDEKEKKK